MEEDIKKARRKSTQAGDDLMCCVDLHNQAQSKCFEEMVTTTLELEQLEVERVEMIQQHLCQYTQLQQETDMFNQSMVEPGGPTAWKSEPGQRQRAVGQRAQNGQHSPCRHGDLDTPV
ncbi:Growth arrest-specific protein 7 [Sciurus carolinensis]|uniref:Growth arrest-specific protein 7 n=1 Tax=Sciurus carolinensis TaxID=30640 RepID=A0AA41N1H7_SCICA|nr:Growth arrest-specific protein 7 [Sciurus carolinensis]